MCPSWQKYIIYVLCEKYQKYFAVIKKFLRKEGKNGIEKENKNDF